MKLLPDGQSSTGMATTSVACELPAGQRFKPLAQDEGTDRHPRSLGGVEAASRLCCDWLDDDACHVELPHSDGSGGRDGGRQS